MIEKEGKVFCREILVWARKQDCKACVASLRPIDGHAHGIIRTATEAHHFPPKGMGGATHRDDRVIPLCREHHEDAQAYRIPREQQERWVRDTLFEFLEGSTVEELRAYFDALEVYKDRPLAVPF